MPIVCGVRFRGTGKVYHFSPGDAQDLQVDERVVVETSRGTELGEVALTAQEVSERDLVGELKPVVRRATAADLQDARRFQEREDGAAEACRTQAERLRLDMKVISAEYSFDGSRLTFFFTAEQRVDFRELVRELARDFRTRIELRQIGVRDEARLVGGLGKCGRSLCCATWLNDFSPVSIRMAKQQDLPLSPMEISGQCGRLLCCLGYENDFYKDVKAKFPKVGKIVDTPAGQGKVIKICVLRETATFLLEDGTNIDMTADQLAGTEPLEIPRQRQAGLTAAQESALDASIGARRVQPAQRPSRPPSGNNGTESDNGDQRPRAPRPPYLRPGTDGAPANNIADRQAPRRAAPSAGLAAEDANGTDQPQRSRRRRSRRRSGPRPEGENPAASGQGTPAGSPSPRPAAENRSAPRDDANAPQGDPSAAPRRHRPRRRRNRSASEASADNG